MFPVNISILSYVDGLYYEAKINISVLLSLFKISTDIHPEGGKFKLFVFSLPIISTLWTRKEKKPERKPVDEPKKRKRDGRILFNPIKKLFNSSVRNVKVNKLDVNLEAGLSDPYVLGLILGVVFPLIEIIHMSFHQVSISLTPVFLEEKFNSKVYGSISFRIIMFIVPILYFFLSKEYRVYRKQV